MNWFAQMNGNFPPVNKEIKASVKTCQLLRGQKYARGNCQAQMTPQVCEGLQRNPEDLSDAI